MYQKLFSIFVISVLLSTTFVNAALTGVGDVAANNVNFAVVTGAPENAGFGPFKNGKKGEWRRRKFPKPVETKKDVRTFDDAADDDMDMDKRSFYGDYGYYYYWCG